MEVGLRLWRGVEGRTTSNEERWGFVDLGRDTSALVRTRFQSGEHQHGGVRGYEKSENYYCTMPIVFIRSQRLIGICRCLTSLIFLNGFLV